MTDAIQPTGSATPPAETPPAGTPVTPPAGSPSGVQGAAATPIADPDARIRQLESELGKARHEAAGYRTQNKGELAEFKKQLAALAGGVVDPAQPTDPAALLAQFKAEREDFQKQIRQSKIELALNDIYTKVGVKPKLTRAMLDSEGLLSGLNPDDAEFSKSLREAVKKVSDENAELKLGPVGSPTPIRSSAPFPGGNNAPPQLGRDDLKGMTDAEINTAREKGQLNQLLGRRS